jgi:hypothetical protein
MSIENPNDWDIGIDNDSSDDDEIMIIPNTQPSSALDSTNRFEYTFTPRSSTTPRSPNYLPESPQFADRRSVNRTHLLGDSLRTIVNDDADDSARTPRDIELRIVREEEDVEVSASTPDGARIGDVKIESFREVDFKHRHQPASHLTSNDMARMSSEYMIKRNRPSQLMRTNSSKYFDKLPDDYEQVRQQEVIARETKYEALKEKQNMKEYIRSYTIQQKQQSHTLANIRALKGYYANVVSWWYTRKISSMINRFKIFKWSVQIIEKNFGSGVASFYEFFVSVLYINILTLMVTFFLLILPWLIGNDAWDDKAVWKGKRAVGHIFLGLIGFEVDRLGKTWFFYGGYPPAFLINKKKTSWSFTFWYPAAIICYYLLSLWILVRAIGKRLKRVNSLTSGSYIYVNTVFNLWDHNTWEDTAVLQMKRAVATKLVERLKYDELQETSVKRRTKREQAIMIVRRLIGLSISAVLIIGAPIAVGLIAFYNSEINNAFPWTTSIITSAINFIFPFLLKLMVWIEGYKNKAVIDNNVVARTYIVKMASTIALMIRVLYPKKSSNVKCIPNEAGLVFWQMLLIDFVVSMLSTIIGNFVLYRVRKITIRDKEDETVVNKRKSTIANRDSRRSSIFSNVNLFKSSVPEDEVEIEKERKKQLPPPQQQQQQNDEDEDDIEAPAVIDNTTRKKKFFSLWRKKSSSSSDGRPRNNRALLEFDVPTNVIELMYRQTIIWIGTIASPMIPLLGVLSCLILFFTKWITMKLTCRFPSNPIADGRSSPYNFILLLFTMILSGIPAIVFMLRDGDNECGPHLNTDGLSPSQMMARSWNNNIVFQNVAGIRDWFNLLTYYIFHPVTLVIVILTLILFAYFLFMRMKMFRTRMMNAELDAKLERDDKQFLLNKYVEL